MESIVIALLLLIAIICLEFTKGMDIYTKCPRFSGSNYSCVIENKTLQPCISISELADDNIFTQYQSGDHIVVYFIDEFCFINERLKLSLSNYTSLELSPWKQRYHTVLQCVEDFTLEFVNISRIHLEFLKLIGCGKFRPMITLAKGSFEVASFISIEFLDNTHSSILAESYVKEIHVKNCSFGTHSKEANIYVNITLPFSNASFINESIIFIAGTNFTNNTASSIYLTSFSIEFNLIIQDCFFLNNNLSSYLNKSITPVSTTANFGIINCIVDKFHGAALAGECVHSSSCYVKSSSVVVINSKFVSNTGSYGVGLRVSGCFVVEVYDSVFIKNVGISGSSICIYKNRQCRSTSFLVRNSTFSENAAQDKGGALLLLFVDNISIYESIFLNNKGNTGGAIFLSDNRIVEVSKSTFSSNSAESGGAMFVNATIENGDILHTLVITRTLFENNSAIQDGGALSVHTNNLLLSHLMFLNNTAGREAGAIRMRVYGKKVNGKKGNVNISGCHWIRNEASTGGAMTIRYSTTMNNIPFKLISSNFQSNFATRNGGAISLHSYPNNQSSTKLLYFSKCNFSMNKAYSKLDYGLGGALMFESKCKLTIQRCSFTRNEANTGGTIYTNGTSFRINNSNFTGNIANRNGGIGYFSEVNVTFTNVTVNDNLATVDSGGIISMTSNLSFAGHSYFWNNTVSNKTSNNGVIYIQDTRDDCEPKLCSLSWNENTTVQFLINPTNTGNLLYGGMLDRCLSSAHPLHTRQNSLSNFIQINGSNYQPSSQAITSEIVKICFCQDGIVNCSSRKSSLELFAGEGKYIQLACLDQMDHPLACNIKSRYEDTQFNLDRGEQIRPIFKCEHLSFHAYTSYKNERVTTLYIESDIFCDIYTNNTLKINVRILPCPLGFENTDDQCNCDKRLLLIFASAKCNTTKNSVRIQTNGWFSYHRGYLKALKHCSLSFCPVSGTENFLLNSDTQCISNHSGTLCGKCVSNYSIILGSWKCMDCSHSRYNFIWLTIVIALMGVILVTFLMLVKMTVSSGTINSLIFYTNMIAFSGMLDSRTCCIHPVLRVLVSWLNLDIGIEVCFYSGMDMYQKTWLQYFFPFYIWLLVGAIIVLCHFSSTVMKLMGMRNIEVLATLFLLSYAKILKTIVSSLSFTSILVANATNTSDPLTSHKVWTYDGEIDYLKGKHLLLFTASLFFLLFLFLPYTLFLLFGQCLQYLPKRRGLRWLSGSTITSIIDAYHAPYTKYHRYWTGLGLLVRCSLFIVYGIFQSHSFHSNLFWISIGTAVLLITKLCYGGKIYKNKVADMFEIFFLSNLGFLAYLLLYSKDSCEWAPNVFLSLSLVAFVIMFLYHANLEANKNIKSYKKISTKIVTNILNLKSRKCKPKYHHEEDKAQSPSTTYIELREALIEN